MSRQEPRKSRRKKGISPREAKHRERSQPLKVSPCPPGAKGGQYKPLTDRQIQDIYQTALRILEAIGMSEVPDALMQQALAKGAICDQRGRLCFPKSMTEYYIDKACKSFIYRGQDSRYDFEVGSDKVYFGTGGAAVQTLDIDDHQYRPSTLADLDGFTRTIDTLDNVSWFTRCCVATDLPDNFDLDVNTAYVLANRTRKPIGTSFTIAEHVDPIIDMFDSILGGDGKFVQRPFCKAHISPVISPLRYGEDAFDVAIACIKRRVPINNIVAAQSGATSPATIAGMLASTLAETLAAMLMVNVFEEGYPMIFSNWPLVIDLRSGAFAGGGGEVTLLNAASAQLSNWLGLPSGAAASMSDAKAVDAQMGLEKALSSLGVGLAGCNMIYESSGMMASLLGASYEAFVIDDEMLSHVHRIIRGIEVTEETLAFDVIRESVYGEGHFLGAAETYDVMLKEYFYPTLSDRIEPRTWQQMGAEDMWQRANRKAKEILSSHRPRYINPSIDSSIRSRFNIQAPYE